MATGDSSTQARIRVTRVLDQSVTIEANRREMNTLEIVKELGKWGELDDIDMQDPDFEDVIHKVY